MWIVVSSFKILGQPVSIDIQVKTPKNFPIDLYYLMDMSSSIKKDLENIIGLGESLGKYFSFKK